jgi:cyanophycinase-like exopeptidase
MSHPLCLHRIVMREKRNARRCILALSCLWLAACAGSGRTGHPVREWLVGNPADVQRPTQGLIVLQGGGDDVDENYRRMGALGGGGDFVVLRASGKDDYNDYILGLCGCDSVETLVFDDREASYDPWVIETIRNAEALFIAGGDQSRYVRFWKGTPVEDAINYVAAKPAPIGGTSAGMAVLGEFVYSAMTPGSLTTKAALADPFAADLTLERDFLAFPVLAGIITDQHLHERDRIGRTVALMARIVHDGWSSEARAVAADRETALHVDPATGVGQVYATADHETPFVYFMRTPGPPQRCEPGAPLEYENIDVYRIGPGGTFDLRKWQGNGGIAYTLSAEAGTLRSSRGEIY